MSFIKKLSIGFGVCVTMMVAFIIGLNLPKNEVKGGGINNVPPKDEVVKVDNPKYHTYKAEDIVLQAGGDTINYSYVPDANATTAPIATYEYKFGNPMSVKMAVYLKSIDVTGVTVGFAYKDSAWDRVSDLDVSEYYTTQSIEVGDNVCKYIYITVTPDDTNVPVGFNTSIKWNLGVAETMIVGSNINSTPVTKTIVSGQEIEESTYAELANENLPEGYYFDAWFLDEDFTKLATFPLTSYGQPLYARYANLPQNVTTYTTYSNGEYSLATDMGDIKDVTIPMYYNDGINGVGLITCVGDSFFADDTTNVDLPASIITIGNNAFQYSPATVNLRSCINLTTIGMGAFLGSSVESLDFSNCINLTTMGMETFESCTKLTSIDLSNCTKLTSIEEMTFYQNTALDSVKLPDTITTIGIRAFYYCTSLENITLPKGIRTLNSQAFDNCTSLKTISIPAGVTSIPDNAFYYCSALQSIDLSACTSLASIGDSAFRGCSALKQITIPKNVTSIGANAFDSCASLTSVILPKGLTTLGAYAFNNCSALGNINLGDTKIDSVGNRTFYQCKNLSSAYIPSTVTSVGDYAFYKCEQLTSVGDLSNCKNLTTIGSNAFNECFNLTNICLDNLLLKTIGSYAFRECKNVTGVIDLSTSVDLTTIDKYTFYGCVKIDGVILPPSLSTINSFAFYNCNNLTNIVFPSSVTTIESSSFYACTRLTSVKISSSSITIKGQAFSDCYALAEVYNLAGANISQGYLHTYAKIVHTTATEPTRIQTIGNVQYYVNGSNFIALTTSHNDVTSITLDSRTTAIEPRAFFRNYNLINADLSKCNDLIAIGEYAFYYCTGLTNITIPANVTTIENEAFRYCYALVEIYNLSQLDIVAGDTSSNNGYIGENAKIIHTNSNQESVVKIINNVKYYISDTEYIALTAIDKTINSITLDSRTTEINSGAFTGCVNIKSISIPQGVLSIGNSAFEGCSNLTGIDLSLCQNLINIGDYAFQNCSNLKAVKLPNSVTNIGYMAFESCGTLESINFPSNLATIGEYAFRYCNSLTSVDLSKCTNLKVLSSNLFFQCAKLTTAIIPNSIETIEYGVFFYCSKLTTLDLSGCTNLTTIGDSVFYYCSALKSITIPSSVNKIGYQAFYQCYQLSMNFKDTTTWYYGTSAQQEAMSGGTSISLSEPAYKVATYFWSTYVNYYWYKV